MSWDGARDSNVNAIATCPLIVQHGHMLQFKVDMFSTVLISLTFLNFNRLKFFFFLFQNILGSGLFIFSFLKSNFEYLEVIL